MAETVGQAIDFVTEDLARAFIAPFGFERAAARAQISLQTCLKLISGEDPRAVLASLTSLRARLAEPMKLPKPVSP